MKVILIGYGTVGKEVEKILHENNIPVTSIIRSKDVLDKNFLDAETFIFICAPSKGSGKEIAHYYLDAFEMGSKIITCEKAFLANHWDQIKTHKHHIRYSASVGGNSGILNAISEQKGNIREIKAVVNGTLNYLGEKISSGMKHEDIYQEVVSKGFAEPGAKNLKEVIEAELNDVVYKTIILANHSGLYSRTIKKEDVRLFPYKENLRCLVMLNKNEIKAGFFEDKSVDFPSGANNILYINGIKSAEGAGAGGRTTAERMFKDFQDLSKNKIPTLL
jgi:homoserine dehydrogenase